MEPVLRAVGLHQVLVGVEEHPPVVIDACHPDGQHWRLEAGAQVIVHGLLLRVHPEQEPDVVAPRDPDLALAVIEVGGVLHVGRHDPVVEIGDGTSSQHQVRQAQGDL